MKILHTADWHLGKLVHQLHMTEDQAYVLNRIRALIIEEQPDVIIIAGDLYDRAVPPKEAVELLNNTLTEMIFDLGIPVLAITGNHDSSDRLHFGSEMFRRQQLYLQTHIEGCTTPVTLQDEFGSVHFYLIPYMEPADARRAFEDDAIVTHHQAMEAVLTNIQATMNEQDRHVLIGHAFLAGGMESESEERLSMVGGTPYIDVDLFSAFDYVALGHLHQPQRVKHEHIRYAGSILKYSFSEANHKKSVTMVTLNGSGIDRIEQHPLSPKRDMIVKEGYLQEFLEGEDAGSEDYVHIKLLDEGQLLDPMGKLRKVYPNALSLERVGFLGNTTDTVRHIQERKKMSHLDLFQSFYENVKGKEMDENRREYIAEVIQSLMKEERDQ
ncbi:exonuclease SbcCD subunit D [Pontibacillus salicampi]|uniref:Nuclease SbcCD subunit D n=1 Tax=Pontibacillus salicampi TaxID=1449801 RepID=A0ABV6LLH0_9BACI